MPLTAAQITALTNDLAVNTATIVASDGATVQIRNITAGQKNGDTADAVAKWYNSLVSPNYLVWNTAVSLKTIRSLVNLANYTPTDSPPASTNNVTGTNDALLYQNRALACQLKQANAIFLITGEGQIDCSPLQLRQSFNDCMTTIPSGASGANQNAGWGTSAAPGAVRLAMQRLATNAEKLFGAASTAAPNAGNVGADARGSSTNPDTLGYVGAISLNDITGIWGV